MTARMEADMKEQTAKKHEKPCSGALAEWKSKITLHNKLHSRFVFEPTVRTGVGLAKLKFHGVGMRSRHRGRGVEIHSHKSQAHIRV